RGWPAAWAPARFTSTGLISRMRRTALRCALSFLWLAIPAIVTEFLLPDHGLLPVISASYVLAVSAAAWSGGALAGILVSCATIPVLTLVASKGSQALPPHFDPVGLGVLFFISFLVASVAGNRKRFEKVLRTANEQLEGRVRERTAELQQANAALLQANENLRRANSDLQQFAFSASHDLQEPLRTVSIYSQLLGRRYGSQLDTAGQTFLEYLTTAAKRMASLIQDLLTYTRTGEEGEPVCETAEAAQALACALESLSTSIQENSAEVAHGDLPAVKMRGVHLQQIFQNVIGNAIKYRSTEPPRIYVSCQQQESKWVFSVRDNGIGIDPAYKERIFGIFKRLHTADQYSGTGIGLAICKRIVERYGGGIWVESEAGAGATFFFAVPV
ncbi:MAG: sensor histidine kinase, partial [Bryobacteraceae bacterium]